MDRKAELEKLVNKSNAVTVRPLIEQAIFLENKLTELEQGDTDKTAPFFLVCETNPAKQKETPAAKLYTRLLQQYTNVIKVLTRVTSAGETEEDSPLRAWVKSQNAAAD